MSRRKRIKKKHLRGKRSNGIKGENPDTEERRIQCVAREHYHIRETR